MVSAVAQFILFDGTLEGTFPNGCYFYSAFAIFAYQTLDAIDGKQARRTGNSTPLGQLFDHGCDALIANLF